MQKSVHIGLSMALCVVTLALIHFSLHPPTQNLSGQAYYPPAHVESTPLVYTLGELPARISTNSRRIIEPGKSLVYDMSLFSPTEQNAIASSLSKLQASNTIASYSLHNNVLLLKTTSQTGPAELVAENGVLSLAKRHGQYIVEFQNPPLATQVPEAYEQIREQETPAEHSESDAEPIQEEPVMPVEPTVELVLVPESAVEEPAVTEPAQEEQTAEPEPFATLTGQVAREATNYKRVLEEEHAHALADIHERVKQTDRKRNPQPVNSFYTAFNGVVLELSPSEVAAIEESPYVKSVYPNREVTMMLTSEVDLIHASELWKLNAAGQSCAADPQTCLTGRGVRIGIIDTGIDYTHPDFGSCTQSQYLARTCTKVGGGYDFINNDGDPMDDQGHGTHVASIAAAKGDDGNNLHDPGEFWGVAPGATIYAYKALGSDGSGSYEDIIAAIDQAVADGVDVISMSLGGPGDPDDPLATAVDNAVDAGVVVVVAAGNSGPSAQTIGSPGVARKALTVGAIDMGSSIASFSSRGPVEWSGGRINKPDIVAPGVVVCAAQWNTWLEGTAECTPEVESHIAISGTSMATPFVAGLAALLKQQQPTTPALALRQTILMTADDLGRPVAEQGSGRVNALSALQSPITIEADLAFGDVGGATGVTRTVRVTNTQATPVSITIDPGIARSPTRDISNALQFSENAFTIGVGETKTVTAKLVSTDDDAFIGYAQFTVNGRSYPMQYSFARHSTVRVSFAGDHYPVYVLFSSDGKRVYISSFSKSADYEFKVPSGTYSLYALSDFVVPTDPRSYPETDEYIIAKTVTVAPLSTVDVSFSLADAKAYTIESVSRTNDPLALLEWEYGFIAYKDTYGFCHTTYTDAAACTTSQSPLCSWDESYGCFDRSAGYTFTASGMPSDKQHTVYISGKAADGFDTDYIFRYIGVPVHE
jgi:subtilisin family serine protease